MELKIRILTVTKCSPANKQPYTRVDYVLTDKMAKSEKIKGSIVAPMFFSGHEVFDKIPEKIIQEDVTGIVETVDNPRNPLKPFVQLTKIVTKNGTIDLVQLQS